MVKNIVYVEEKVEKAEAIIEGIRQSGYEVLHCVSAAEAFALMRRQDTPLLMLDINIPDMRLREVVRRCNQEFPSTVLAVFIDFPNVELISKLINRHGIYKIFISPWDTQEIIGHIEDAMDYAEILDESIRKEQVINQEANEFDQSIKHSTDILNEQKYAYPKIMKMMETLLTSHTADQDPNMQEKNARYYEAVFECMRCLIKAHLTAQVTVDTFETVVKNDLKEYPGLVIEDVICCLIEEIPHEKLAAIRAIVLLSALYATHLSEKTVFMSESRYINDSWIELSFTITIQGQTREQTPFIITTQHMLKILSKDIEYEWSTDQKTLSYHLMMPISYDV
ncbi:MAG: hypothetical protein GX567_04375 [Clostridia bacterium]|nr:hypothetical protein [Clostridia bacterium]